MYKKGNKEDAPKGFEVFNNGVHHFLSIERNSTVSIRTPDGNCLTIALVGNQTEIGFDICLHNFPDKNPHKGVGKDYHHFPVIAFDGGRTPFHSEWDKETLSKMGGGRATLVCIPLTANFREVKDE